MVQQIMLALHCKKTEAVDLKSPIWQYISNTYSPEQAHQADEDLEEIQGQRNQIAGMAGALPALKAVMLRYLAALNSIETRFPISKDTGHVKVSFLWYDAFRSTKKAEQISIHFEKAAMLFNIGAISSQIAVATDRTTDAGRKEASALFKEAAGAFSLLRDVGMKMDSPRPPDLGPEAAAMLESLMLAQAQECVFEKAQADGKSPSLLARVAKQVSELYGEVATALGQSPLSSHLDKTWVTHAGVKVALFEAQTWLSAADAFRLDDAIASEITRLKDAQKVLAGLKVGRGISKDLSDTVKAADINLSQRLKVAERENAAVYLQRVPDSSSLPDIKGVLLVKPVLPKLDGMTGAGGGALFSTVIPDNSAKALSRYSDLVDAMWREQREKLDIASDDARLRLSQWELPQALQALDVSSPSALPEGLKQELEQIEDMGGAAFLHGLALELKGLREVAAGTLNRAASELKEEAEEDGCLRERHGAAWNRPTSAALNRTLMDKIASYRANLKAAAESDARLESRLVESEPEFSKLSIDAALAVMPRLQAPMVAVVEGEPATIVATLRQALDALASLSAERATLEEALKGEKARDDVLPKIMASSEGHAELFARELAKYDTLKADISGNVERQGQLLAIIDSKQSAFRSAFGFAEWRAACKAAAAGVRSAVVSFQEVRDYLSEGARFYTSLQEAVSVLQQHVGDFCLTRRIQREEMEEEQRRRETSEAASLQAAQQYSRMSLGGGGRPPASAPQAQRQYSSSQYQAPHPPPGGTYPPAYGGPPHPSYSHVPPPPPPPPHHHTGSGVSGQAAPHGSRLSQNSNGSAGRYSQQQQSSYVQQQQQQQLHMQGHSGYIPQPPQPPSAQPQGGNPRPPPPAPPGYCSFPPHPQQHHQQPQQHRQWSPDTGYQQQQLYTPAGGSMPNMPRPPPPPGHWS